MPLSDKDLLNMSRQCLIDNSTSEGICASGKEEIYGCIFGRDTSLSVLKILNAHSRSPQLELLEVCRRALITLTSLQGQTFNYESGEEPGKFIHEFRRQGFDHLISLDKPWYIYPDGYLKNYDSIDSTPLALIALHRYWQITQDNEFLLNVLPSVELAINWIITYGDIDKDLLIEYDTIESRTHGGLVVQSWTDSHQSLRQANGQMPKYPIAPVEAQSYAWLALKLWGEFYLQQSPSFGKKINSFANKLKTQFNQNFMHFDGHGYYPVQALDGDKNPIFTVTGNSLLPLWATYFENGKPESIIENHYIPYIVERSFKSDMFDETAGIRTMSTLSPTFNCGKDSYHNGSFWPILNGLIHEGLILWKFDRHAELLKKASLYSVQHFETPIELYIKSDKGHLTEFLGDNGQKGCLSQSWSAAAILDWLS